jgi:hypothetical protein
VDRWRAAAKLTVAVGGRGVRFLISGLQKYFEKFWRCSVIVLSVMEKFLQILLQKPKLPTQPAAGMNDHTKPWDMFSAVSVKLSVASTKFIRASKIYAPSNLSIQASCMRYTKPVARRSHD